MQSTCVPLWAHCHVEDVFLEGRFSPHTFLARISTSPQHTLTQHTSAGTHESHWHLLLLCLPALLSSKLEDMQPQSLALPQAP
jgi:hypothetical protein